MEEVAWPSGLQKPTSAGNFKQNIEKVVLPSGLQKLIFDDDFI